MSISLRYEGFNKLDLRYDEYIPYQEDVRSLLNSFLQQML